MNITLLGFGEVGRILAEDLVKHGHSLAAWDIKFNAPAGFALREHAATHAVRVAASPEDALVQAELVISAVTASQTVAVAQACAAALATRAKGDRPCHYLDLNSASPGAKIEAAQCVESAGGHYVEAAVMTSVPPYRLKVPMLVGGPRASPFLATLHALGFHADLASRKLGIASATKMSRSVMIKGLEAMVIESFSTARAYGVEAALIASLHETFPGIDWEKQASYFFQRVIEHGRRRSEEMVEAAHAVRDAGLTPLSAQGTAARQAWMADLSEHGIFGPPGAPGHARSPDWRTEADRLLAHVHAQPPVKAGR